MGYKNLLDNSDGILHYYINIIRRNYLGHSDCINSWYSDFNSEHSDYISYAFHVASYAIYSLTHSPGTRSSIL